MLKRDKYGIIIEYYSYKEGATVLNIRAIPYEATYIITELKQLGYEAYLVGGCIRDLWLGKEPKDFDITTSATPEQVMASFKHVIPTGLKHGTVTVLINDIPFEITTFRSDGTYTDGRKPDFVTLGVSIKEDISRRDLTINGLLFDGNAVLDLCNGIGDLTNKVVRTIGDPTSRFLEDKLRMMRAIRFSCQLGFTIDSKTLQAIRENSYFIRQVSWERIRNELEKILLSNNAEMGLILLDRTGLLRHILPELYYSANFKHTLRVIEKTPKTLNVRLAALLHAVAKPQKANLHKNHADLDKDIAMLGQEIALSVLNRLKYDNKTIASVATLVREYTAYKPHLREGTIKEFLVRIGKHNIADLLSLQLAYIVSLNPPYDLDDYTHLKIEIDRIIEANEPLKIKDLAINGKDLITLGVQPGENLGVILHNLLALVLEKPELNTKDALIKLLELG